MDNYINELNELRIHELRDLARKMGVNSPTTLKKDEIIKEILGILSGEKEPASKTTKQGRPPRNQDKTLSITDVIKGDELNKKPDYANCIYDCNYEFPMANTLASKPISIEQSTEPLEEIDAEGYLYLERNIAFVRTEGYFASANDVVVPFIYVKDRGLKNGQFLKGKIFPKPAGEFPMLHKIQYEKPDEFDFDCVQSTSLGAEYSGLALKGVKRGGRYLVKRDGRQDLYDFSAKIANELAVRNDCEVKYLCLNALMELIPHLNDKIDQIITPFNKTPDDIVQAVELVFERCKREVETGKHIVLVVQDFMSLIKYYQLAAREASMLSDISYGTLVSIKNLLFASKNINEKSSFTLILCEGGRYPQAISDCIEYELMPLINNVF